ncbi:MAG: TIGR00303 family protein [Cyanobacteriota bacterium]|nr:TIGR00303 family protein [Cyanobacteriota bacterium]
MRGPLLLHGAPDQADRWAERWRQGWPATQVLLLLAATETAAVPGISAAGATPEARLATAAADAELLVLGPQARRPHALPPLPAGVSPALISHVVLEGLSLAPLVVDLGCAVAPSIPHLRLPAPSGLGPARCLSTGQALPRQRAEALVEQGRRWGRNLARQAACPSPLLIAECVPGGTTTAQGVLCGLGVEAAGLVSGSLRHPAHDLKQALVEQGACAAGLGLDGEESPDPLAVVAALGDPMQPLAAGLLLEAALADVPLLLAGGSQMVAVWALALALARPHQRIQLVAATALATTRWVAEEPGSDLVRLLQHLGRRWQVEPLAFCTTLAFSDPCHPALAAFEEGFVKEGVGAGGLAALWELSGRDSQELALRCHAACDQLLPVSMAGGGERLRSLHG